MPLSFDGLPAASFAQKVDGRPVWWNADAAAGTVSAATSATSETIFRMLSPLTSFELPVNTGRLAHRISGARGAR
jgi:hypothetical protein